MRLNLWLAQTKTPIAAFARRVSVSRQALYRYMDGTRYPEQSVRVAIFRATNGAVTSNDFDPDLSTLKVAS